MKSQEQQREFSLAPSRETDQLFKHLNGATSSFVPDPLNQRFVDTRCHSAVMEERKRLAREIHDTLVQEFAGILLHIESVNGSNEVLRLSECLARVRELAKSGLED